MGVSGYPCPRADAFASLYTSKFLWFVHSSENICVIFFNEAKNFFLKNPYRLQISDNIKTKGYIVFPDGIVLPISIQPLVSVLIRRLTAGST